MRNRLKRFYKSSRQIREVAALADVLLVQDTRGRYYLKPRNTNRWGEILRPLEEVEVRTIFGPILNERR